MNKLNSILAAVAVFLFVGWLTTNGFAADSNAPYTYENGQFSYGGGVSSGAMIEQNQYGVLSTSSRLTGDIPPVVGQHENAPATEWPKDYSANEQTIEEANVGVLQTSPRLTGGDMIAGGQFPEEAVPDATYKANLPPCETIEQSNLGVLSTNPRVTGDTSGMYSKLEGTDFCAEAPGM